MTDDLMNDDLISRLREAGEVLDRRGDETLGEASGDDGLRVLAIAPPPPSGGRRGPGLLAAAAAVFVVALVAAVAWNQEEAPLSVASGGATVALVPAGGVEGWDRLEATDEALRSTEYGTMLVTPAGSTGPDRMARAMTVNVYPHEWFEGGYENIWTLVSGSAIEGHLSPLSEASEQRTLITKPVDTGAGSMSIQVTAGRDAVGEEMLALAALVDPTMPIEDQQLEGWDVLARSNASRLGGHSYDLTLIGDDGSFQSITTLTGVADEAALLLVAPHTVDSVEVRGQSGWVASSGQTVSLTWVESPGLVVQLSHSGSQPDLDVDLDQLVAEIMALADDLVAVDSAGWADLAAQATPMPDLPTMTTTSLPSGTALSEDGINAVIPGHTADGREYTVWVENGQICKSFAGQTGHDCVADAAHHLDGPDHALPKIAPDPDGNPAFLYGFLPLEAEAVQVAFKPVSVEAITQGPIRDAGYSRAGRLWVTTIPSGYAPALVTYFDDDHQVVADHPIGTTAG